MGRSLMALKDKVVEGDTLTISFRKDPKKPNEQREKSIDVKFMEIFNLSGDDNCPMLRVDLGKSIRNINGSEISMIIDTKSGKIIY